MPQQAPQTEAKGRKRTAKAAAEKPAPRRRKKESEAPAPRGLAPDELSERPPASIDGLKRAIEEDGGAVIGAYREPLGGHWTVLAGLPIDRVAPTPFQRDLSQAHIARLTDVMDRLDRFLDPIIAVRTAEGPYWTPNGNHRLSALRKLGARSVVALVMPDMEVAYKILALNTEKAHNLREKALEVVRMARSLASLDDRPERSFALEFEEPALLTLGLCYEARGRFSGGPYHPVLRHIDEFLDEPLAQALPIREVRATSVLALDDAVGRAVASLRERGFESPYLKAFVVARVNPLRFRRGGKAAFGDTIDAMTRAAERFDPAAVRPTDLSRAGGPPAEE